MLTRIPISLQPVGHNNDPEPEHGRGDGRPTHGTDHPHTAALGLLDDMQREDDERGYEDEPDTYRPQPQSELERVVIQAGHPLLHTAARPTGATCPRCTGHGCPVCSFRGVV